jgi:hypothetical protein
MFKLKSKIKQIINIPFSVGCIVAFLIITFAFPLCKNWIEYAIVIFFLVANFCFLSLVITEMYKWNNGTCKETGKPWIEESNYQDYRSFVSEKGLNSYRTHIEYLTIDYNDEKAKKIDKHFKIINSLKHFKI